MTKTEAPESAGGAAAEKAANTGAAANLLATSPDVGAVNAPDKASSDIKTVGNALFYGVDAAPEAGYVWDGFDLRPVTSEDKDAHNALLKQMGRADFVK